MNSGGGSRRCTTALTDAKVFSCRAPAMPEHGIAVDHELMASPARQQGRQPGGRRFSRHRS